MLRDNSIAVAFAKHHGAELASQMRIAFSSMAWNTGSNSPGELEITLSTSAVAVCCSSDRDSCLAQLVEQPGVLDGDDGLPAKLLMSSICLSVKGRASWR